MFHVRRTYFTQKAITVPMSKCKSSFTDLVKDKLSFLKTKFYFEKNHIEVMEHPVVFYETLKDKITNAEDRIFFASLYIGKTETELVKCINDALRSKPRLKVFFLIDGLRGTRESPDTCSASLLTQLVKEHGDRVDVRLYMTPAYSGWKKALLPKRINEGIGLQHMKIYGFDNEVILSGANLSFDYFSNRQDRYYLFKSKAFTDYYFKLHQLVSNFSYQAKYFINPEKYLLLWPKSNITVEPSVDNSKFLTQTSKLLTKFLNEDHSQLIDKSPENLKRYPTVVYPISQFTPLFKKSNDNSTEKPSILALLSSLNSPSNRWTITAGYFNILPEIEEKLLSSPSNTGTVITASPCANGFYKSKGISNYLPDAYLYLSKKFLEGIHSYGKSDTISLYEWKKGIVNTPGGWSYHAKGIWVSGDTEDDPRPVVTVIGSSNYTKRAYSLDLETNVIAVTEDEELKNIMQHEVENLMSNTRKLALEDFSTDSARHVSTRVKVATELLGRKL
ncbi:CDP-diacylglycerol--glycerol-3-phosphate 3-phosphatidyltransferase Ecym_1287 [Eremothecium cymbalariae DBVPG|uniref:CDP-diacylglycerol--glycerol-3-phosphate 3-phosphatidyltransferase n=1 Tax=Eremothecium cymbalariae (strain CBS 270.75 / DBVPG 7215 / KCTC 17166 / NRRL Y-17582) TaxID=931890 RepID=G8JN62_ERECY|nr:hypothetical protein Ecym_1287 [Eremothecium cymbalariae DBVPG\